MARKAAGAGGRKAGQPVCRDAPCTVLRFPGLVVQVRLCRAPAVERALSQVLCGWGPERCAVPDPAVPAVCVQGGPEGYRVQSARPGPALTGLGIAGAVCAIIVDLVQDFCQRRPGILALHSAAFRLNGHLIALGGPPRAGKSTLAARLTQAPDVEVFCDDVLPVTADGAGLAPGIAPRLRLPLPAGADTAFRAHVGRHMGPRDDRYGYLCAPGLAPHGSRAPLSVVLILDRRDRSPARLHHEPEGRALHFLLAQTLSGLQAPDAAYARLTGLLAGITCLRLVYSDLDEAVALIRQAFGRAGGTVDIGPVLPQAAAATAPPGAFPANRPWARNPEAVMQARGESAFLWVPGKPMIWHMNLLARAVWVLLEIPGTARDIGQLLCEHFPDTDRTVLIRDVETLLQALSAAGLVEPAGPDGAFLPGSDLA